MEFWVWSLGGVGVPLLKREEMIVEEWCDLGHVTVCDSEILAADDLNGDSLLSNCRDQTRLASDDLGLSRDVSHLGHVPVVAHGLLDGLSHTHLGPQSAQSTLGGIKRE